MFTHDLPPVVYGGFDTFAPVSAQDMGWNVANRVAASPVATFNPFVIYGPTSAGKSHLLEGIVRARRTAEPELPILYRTADEFMNELICAIKLNDQMAFKERNYRSTLVVVDGVQFFARKPSTISEFIHVINRCQERGVQMVFSIDQEPGTLQDVPLELTSRLQGGLVHQMHLPNEAQRQVLVLKRYGEDIVDRIDSNVIDLVTARVSDPRKLIGTMNKLVLAQEVCGYYLTQDHAEALIEQQIKEARRDILIKHIIDAVCNHFGISPKEIKSPIRERKFARPRQVVMYLARVLTPRSLPEIGRELGGA